MGLARPGESFVSVLDVGQSTLVCSESHLLCARVCDVCTREIVLCAHCDARQHTAEHARELTKACQLLAHMLGYMLESIYLTNTITAYKMNGHSCGPQWYKYASRISATCFPDITRDCSGLNPFCPGFVWLFCFRFRTCNQGEGELEQFERSYPLVHNMLICVKL